MPGYAPASGHDAPPRARAVSIVLTIVLTYLIIRDILARRRARPAQPSRRDISLVLR